MKERAEESPTAGVVCTDVSRELVVRIQGGDRAAWDDLYLRYHDSLLFAIRCRLGPRLRARLESEDILHSVVKDAFRDLEGFEPRGPGSLRRFLHVCILNKIRSKAEFHRARKRSGDRELSPSLLEHLPGTPEEEPSYFAAERFGSLERGMQALPEHLREVILLRTIEGLSNVETADVLERTPAATSKLYNRALARLSRLVTTGEAE